TEAEAKFYTEGGCVKLQVRDNGQGFDQELQGSATTSVKGRGGNGLLSMRKRAAELGGEFRVDSKRGQGTAVWLNVPIAGSMMGREELATLVSADGHHQKA